jgi:hypothetical protein
MDADTREWQEWVRRQNLRFALEAGYALGIVGKGFRQNF